jgi:DNA (cytosine-5)-methyltransferase 1
MKLDIRNLRIKLGLQQRELAASAKISSYLLRKLERGLGVPGRQEAERIASVLGVSADSLIDAQHEHAKATTPGEGYTTSTSGNGEIFPRRKEVPAAARRVIDLFCGAGGLSYGFEQSGQFVTSLGIDLLPDRIDTFVENHAHAVGIAGDIRDLPIDKLEKLAGQVDVVVGGPPCQGFSSIRPFRNLTEGDPRNSLVEHYALVIEKIKPSWFVFENVVGILTHEGGRSLHELIDGLREAGYLVDWRIMNAAMYGVPQYRERIVIVGNRLGVKFSWPAPSHLVEYKSMAGRRSEVIQAEPLFSNRLAPVVTLMDAIGDLPKVRAGENETTYSDCEKLTEYQRVMRAACETLTLHQATRHSEKMLEIIRHAGANISALPPGMVKSGFSSCYSRLDPNKPSTTLTVNFVHPASNRCIHPFQDRALTPREGARIQSFPDQFSFRGTTAQIVKQIGNAVPPRLGKVIATAILESEARKLPLSRSYQSEQPALL